MQKKIQYYQTHKEEIRGKERASLLELFEEGKSITLKELFEKRGISEMAGIRKLKEMGKVREIINYCKKNRLVKEIEENVFQINPESPSFKTLKKISGERKRENPTLAT